MCPSSLSLSLWLNAGYEGVVTGSAAAAVVPGLIRVK